MIKTPTGSIVPMPCPKCGRKDGIHRISMSAYSRNGFFCPCGFEATYP